MQTYKKTKRNHDKPYKQSENYIQTQTTAMYVG